MYCAVAWVWNQTAWDSATFYLCGLSGIISIHRFLSVATVSVCLSDLWLHWGSDGLMALGVSLWNTGAHSHWGHASHRLHWEGFEDRRATEAGIFLGYTTFLWKCCLVWKRPTGFVEHPQIHYSVKLFHSVLLPSFSSSHRLDLHCGLHSSTSVYWSISFSLTDISCNELITYWILSWYFAS